MEKPDMWFFPKLKAETSITMLLPAILTVIGLVIFMIVFGPLVANGFVAIVFLIYSVFSLSAFIRTQNNGYLIAALFQFFGSLWIGSTHHGIFFVSDELRDLFSVVTLVLMVWMQILLMTRKFKWRGREILELAAQPVDEVTNGFTERPRPSGKTASSREDAIEFAQFVSRNLIAMPYVESDRVVFVPVTMAQSFRYLFPWNRGYHGSTWVSVDNNGLVSVNIAKQDYLRYKENLSFDQLCQSLGDLFIEFMETFKRGEGIRIIDKMNALRINPYT
jgi:hypothetical protein